MNNEVASIRIYPEPRTYPSGRYLRVVNDKGLGYDEFYDVISTLIDRLVEVTLADHNNHFKINLIPDAPRLEPKVDDGSVFVECLAKGHEFDLRTTIEGTYTGIKFKFNKRLCRIANFNNKSILFHLIDDEI